MLIGGWLADRAVEGLLKISFYLDTVIYRLAGWSYKIFYIMGGVIVDADSTAQAIVNKIYTILLIFMVFVVAYNMLLYIINPDKIQDGSAGAGNLVKKIAISLVVIVASPLFFDVLYDVQREIIDYNVIGNIILGDSYGNENVNARCDTIDVENSGDAIVSDIYTAFLYPVNGLEASNCCDDTFPTDDELRADPSMAKYCAGYINSRATGGISGFADVALSAINQDEDYQYLGVVSTAAGIIMAIYFLSFCVNLGIRLFKLLALELIAPIPALLDLLPGKSGTLENWFKTVMKVYAQVFIYQAIVFSLVWLATLVPGLLNQVFQSIEVDSSGTFNGFLLLARVLLIVALFQACKEVPKMLSEVLGIKGEGGILKAAGLKSLGSFGKKVGMGAFGIGATAFGAVSNFSKNMANTDGNLGKKLLSGTAGAASSIRRNVWGMRNAKSFKDIRESTKASSKAVQDKRIARSSYRNNHGGTLGGVVQGRIQDAKRSGANFLSDNFGYKDSFLKKQAKEEALKHHDNIYKDKIESVWKNDSMWSEYDAISKKIKNGDTVFHKNANGEDVAWTMDELNRLKNQRKLDLISNPVNQNKIREGLAELRADSATHGGTDGIMDASVYSPGGEFDGTKDINNEFINKLEAALGKIDADDYLGNAKAIVNSKLEDYADLVEKNGSIEINGKTYSKDEFFTNFKAIGDQLDAEQAEFIKTVNDPNNKTLKSELDTLATDKEYQNQKFTIGQNKKTREAIAAQQKKESTSESDKQK